MEEQKKKSSSVLLIVIITALITCILTSLLFVGGYFVWKKFFSEKTADEQGADQGSEDPQDEQSPTEPTAEEPGTITGTLIFPSEYLPAQKVCAEDVDTGDEFCTETEDGDSTYSLEVPAGSYHVYAQDLRDVPPYGTNDYRAYYNQFVTCGLSVDCLSHENIVVVVGAGETVEEIDPNDWYNAE